jgi:hypothetical protein
MSYPPDYFGAYVHRTGAIRDCVDPFSACHRLLEVEDLRVWDRIASLGRLKEAPEAGELIANRGEN